MTAELTTEYYLRVSVKETDFMLQQYNMFTKYSNGLAASNILEDMLLSVIREYKLDSTKVLVEQFSKV